MDVQGRRAARAGGPTGATSSTTTAGKRDAIVFVVGGGSYVEYVNLLEWNARSTGVPLGTSNASNSTRRVTYGATEILTPHHFVQALANLAD